MSLPSFLQSALWSYDLDKLNKEKHKKIIITRIFNHGTREQVKWVLNNYSLEEIKEVVLKPLKGRWYEDSLNYWLKIFDLDLSSGKKEKALFSIDFKK